MENRQWLKKEFVPDNKKEQRTLGKKIKA